MDKRTLIGERHPSFKTGKSRDANGYVTLTSKKWGKNTGRREHRVVVEGAIGRRLSPDEIVHHRNGDKSDNRIENLEITTRAGHNRAHGNGAILECASCRRGKWFAQSQIDRLPDVGSYQCKPCSGGQNHSRTCQRCGAGYLGGKNSRFCGKCTRKNKCR